MRQFRLLMVFSLGMYAFCAAQEAPPALPNTPEMQITSLADAIDFVRPSIVRVTAKFPNGTSTGTGFFINSNWTVVTANHVVNPPGVAGNPTEITISWPLKWWPHPKVIIVGAGAYLSVRSSLIASDNMHDIAILAPDKQAVERAGHQGVNDEHGNEINLSAPIRPAKLELRHIRDGIPLFMSGYPLDLPSLITTFGYVASSAAGSPPNKDDKAPHIDDVLWADIHANHGNSGGPVFALNSGAVIGIQVAVHTTPVELGDNATGKPLGLLPEQNGQMSAHPLDYNTGLAEVISATRIADLARQHKIAFETEQ